MRYLQYRLLSQGLEIATNTVAFATKFLPFATKISGEVANLRLYFDLCSFETKALAVAHFAGTFANINKENNKIVLFLAVNFLSNPKIA